MTQLAGYIMWMPACLLYAVAAAIVFGIWLSELQRLRVVTKSQTSDEWGEAKP